jgi:sec-independent protein translocase protein TatB
MDFFGINGWEFVVLLLLAMFIFGPDRLPKAISDGVRMLRNLRDMARNATGDLSRELGTDISLEDLNPKTLIRKHLLSEEDEQALRRPFDDLYKDVQQDLRGVHNDLRGVRDDLNQVRGGIDVRGSLKPVSRGGPAAAAATEVTPALPEAGPQAYDIDAT